MQLPSSARKAVATGLAVSTILWSVSLFALPFAFAAPHSNGCLVNAGGTVWLIENGMRRGFTSAEVFLSHGYNFGQVIAANSEDTVLPVGPIIVYADGSLVKGPNDPLVYLVANGQKRGFVSGSVFTGLGFSFANIMSAAVNTFADLPTGANLESATERHTGGTLVKDGSGTVWKMTATGRMGVPSMAVFNSYGWSWSNVVAANAADLAAVNEGVVTARPGCSDTGSTPPVSGTMNVSLSGPATSTVINDESLANLANFVFSGSGTITALSLKRTGVSADTSLSNVYLFDGGTRLTDAASVSSGSVINFTNTNGLFSVNGSRTVSVKADLAGTAGETLGVQLTSVTLSSGSVGGLPVSGNNHSVATATLADVNLASALTVSDTDPGNDIVVFQGNAAVTTRDVTLTRLAVRQIGSINSSDIKNFELYVDGTLISTVASLDANGYAAFTGLNKTLTTGTRVIKIVADVVGGSGRNVQMSLRGAYDITVVDTQYNASPVVTATGSFPFGDSTTFSVNAGTVTAIKASDSQSEPVTVGGSDVSLGKWTLTAYGESVKIETLTIAVDTTGGTTSEHTLRNGRIMIDGAQYGSTTSVAAVDSLASGQSFTVNYMLQPGTPANVEFRADMYDNEGTDNIGAGTVTSIQAALFGSGSSNNAIPQVSLGTLDVPGSAVNANDVTVSSGTISLTQLASYPSQTTAVPQSSYKLGQWTLTGNSAEAVNINTFDVGFAGTDAWDPSSDLSNVFIKYGSSTSSIKGTVADGSSTSLANSWSQAFTLAKNESVNVELWATIASSATDSAGSADTMIAYLRATGITAVSGTTVYADADSDTDNTDAGNTGQTITAGTGTLTSTTNSALTPSAKLVDDSGTLTSVVWNFAAVTDSFTITDLSFSIGSAVGVSSVAIKDGSTTVATKPAAASMSYSGLSIPVASGTTKPITVELTMSPITTNTGTGLNVVTTMVAFTSRNSSGTSDASANDSGQSQENNPAGNALWEYKAIPTLTAEALSSSVLVASVKTLARFSVDSGTTGDLAWKEIMLDLNKSAGPTFLGSSVGLYDVTGGANTLVSTTVAFQADTDSDADFDAADTTAELLITVGAKSDDNVEQQVNGKKTYEVRANITGTIGTDDYITVALNETSAQAAEAVFTSADNAASADSVSFTWSDMSLSNHDTGTADWVNDDLVRNLPLNWSLNAPT